MSQTFDELEMVSMTEDNFEKWYWEVWEPSDLYRIARDDLRAAYKAGWKRSREVDEVLTELVQIAQENGEYD